jgi:hypothetical protein
MITEQDTGRRATVRLDTIPTQVAPYLHTAEGLAEYVEAMLRAELQPCLVCNEIGHFVTVRVAPRPDDANPSATDKLVESCSHCMFGPVGKPQRGLLFRLRGEQAEGDDHDLTVEVLDPEGRWIA